MENTRLWKDITKHTIIRGGDIIRFKIYEESIYAEYRVISKSYPMLYLESAKLGNMIVPTNARVRFSIPDSNLVMDHYQLLADEITGHSEKTLHRSNAKFQGTVPSKRKQ